MRRLFGLDGASVVVLLAVIVLVPWAVWFLNRREGQKEAQEAAERLRKLEIVVHEFHRSSDLLSKHVPEYLDTRGLKDLSHAFAGGPVILGKAVILDRSSAEPGSRRSGRLDMGLLPEYRQATSPEHVDTVVLLDRSWYETRYYSGLLPRGSVKNPGYVLQLPRCKVTVIDRVRRVITYTDVWQARAPKTVSSDGAEPLDRSRNVVDALRAAPKDFATYLEGLCAPL